MCVNLFHAVENPFTKYAVYDFDMLYNTAYVMQRLMDDVIDLELECIDKIIAKVNSDPEPKDIKAYELNLWKSIKESCRKGRRTGSGITALGDTIAAVGLKYGSKKSITLTEQIYETIKLACYRCSVDIAQELGPFPVWDHKKEKKNAFLLRLKGNYIDDRLYADMKKYGRRNISLLTTAPTGSVSTQACLKVEDRRYYNTTSGIEPLFMKSYTRRKKGNPNDEDFRTDFVDQNGDSWMEFDMYHSGISAWKSVNTRSNIENSPYKGATASEINWISRVKLQGVSQKHVDHSISSTVNLPTDVDKQEISDIFIAAYDNGCKGITVYRDGCRTGVLIDDSHKIEIRDAPKRPKELNCEVFHVTIKSQEYFVLLGLLENQAYEVFAGLNNKSVIPKKVKTGKIIKKARGKYLGIFDDGTELTPISAFSSPEEETVTRLVSTALRHGADLSFLIHQLEKSVGDMQSFSKSIARALKRKIKDGTKVFGEECPNCSSTLVRQEGCIKCTACGFGKC